jgi:anti-anti-sigma factor
MSDIPFLDSTVEDGLTVVRFRYIPSFRFEDYDLLEAELTAAAGDPAVRGVVINLDALEYLTSRMLGMLTAVAHKLLGEGRAVAVCRLRPEAMRAFKLTRLDSVIPSYPTEEEAKRALA